MNIEDVIQPQNNARIESAFNESNKFKDSVSVVPTHTPTTWNEQVVVYKNGTTYRLYIYVDDTWKYISLT